LGQLVRVGAIVFALGNSESDFLVKNFLLATKNKVQILA